MNLSTSLPRLAELEFATLYRNAANWSLPRKALLGGGLICVLLVLADVFYLSTSREKLHQQEAQEAVLLQQFALKSTLAGNLEAYTLQIQGMQEAFAKLLQQLPTDTEVPGLLEDITRLGMANGLAFEGIKLLDERVQPLYVELPLQIGVTGAYHDLATFISALAGLPRVITLHDLAIRPANPQAGRLLRLELLAKTYRYNEQGLLP
ncbi:type 4a pilus biogenesis protein PilO [Pseudomonas sp. ADAK18]|uniref:type 4a pilus biogenesis protein PilO n=1 Tax=Pseudomonas sp. ADAK18 TaxID=2730848 RepID=UPI0014641929|nr:type 4a pilus biogenesis protein PilO [Pseudomonas sp. ADAK18]QJI32337.1 type 4a pilus biogenesis protein PilO [Pseudomonas sp. ADAK18]